MIISVLEPHLFVFPDVCWNDSFAIGIVGLYSLFVYLHLPIEFVIDIVFECLEVRIVFLWNESLFVCLLFDLSGFVHVSGALSLCWVCVCFRYCLNLI